MVLFLLNACSLQSFDRILCEDAAICRESFGTGSICNHDFGYCEDVALPYRCESFPPNIDENWDAFRGARVVGRLADYSSEAEGIIAGNIAIMDMLESPIAGDIPLVVISCDIQNHWESHEHDRFYEESDDLTRLEATSFLSDWLLHDYHPVSLIGPGTPDETQRAFNIFQGAGIPVISHFATSESISAGDNQTPTDDAPGLLWQTVESDRRQAKAIALHMLQQGINSAIVIYKPTTYGSGLKDHLQFEFEEYNIGMETYIWEPETPIPETETAQAIVYLSSYIWDYVALFDRLSEIENHPDVDLYFGAYAMNRNIADFVSFHENVSNSYSNRIWITGPSLYYNRDFAVFDSFNHKYIEHGLDANEHISAAHAYDATWMTFFAHLWSITQEQSVAQGFRKLSDPTGISVPLTPEGWSSFFSAVQSGNGIDIEGASGPLNYDLSTETLSHPIDIWQINADQQLSPYMICFDEDSDGCVEVNW